VFKDANNVYLTNQTSVSAKLNSQYVSLSGIEEAVVIAIGITTSVIAALGKERLII
jgi:hypothetical protein